MNVSLITQITKNRRVLKKSTHDMDFDYSNRLSDLTKYYSEFFNESIQTKSVCKNQFGQFNDKRFYFSNGILSLPYGHSQLEHIRKEKNKYRNNHTVIQSKKYQFLKEESKVMEKILRLNILKQIYSQIPLLYELNLDTKFITSGWKTTKEYNKNDSLK